MPASLEHFKDKWPRLSGSKTRPDKDLEPGFDSIKTGKAPAKNKSDSSVLRRTAAIGAIVAASLGLSACTNAFTSVRTQGYEISQSALSQVRPGQSKELVVVVMGSPQTQGTFGDESAFYYVETKIEQTQFGLSTVQERTVLAVYFDANDKVKDKAVYTLQDGRVFALESRRTPSFGQDRTFIEQILSSF